MSKTKFSVETESVRHRRVELREDDQGVNILVDGKLVGWFRPGDTYNPDRFVCYFKTTKPINNDSLYKFEIL